MDAMWMESNYFLYHLKYQDILSHPSTLDELGMDALGQS